MLTIHITKYTDLVLEKKLTEYLAKHKINPDKATFEFRGNLVSIHP